MKRKKKRKCDITKLPLYRLAELETYKNNPESLLVYAPYIEKKAKLYISRMRASGFYLDPKEAEKDMIQDLWVKVLLSRESYNVISDTQFKTYISHVLDNYAKNWVCKTYRKYEKSLDIGEEDALNNLGTGADSVQKDAEIHITEEGLGIKEKKVLDLMAKGYTQTEIADITGISQPSVSIAKAKLKEKLLVS